MVNKEIRELDPVMGMLDDTWFVATQLTAANTKKATLDEVKIAMGIDGTFLPLDGTGTMTGDLDMGNQSIKEIDAVILDLTGPAVSPGSDKAFIQKADAYFHFNVPDTMAGYRYSFDGSLHYTVFTDHVTLGTRYLTFTDLEFDPSPGPTSGGANLYVFPTVPSPGADLIFQTATGILNITELIAANTAKITNATHTGDVTGATALSLESVAITGQILKGVAVGADEILISDSAAAGALKRTTVTQFLTDVAGVTSINADITAAQIIAAGTGLGIVDAGATHTLSIDSTVVTLTGSQILTNKTIGHEDFTNHIHADVTHVEVRNETGGAIVRGDAVYVSGYSIGQDLPLVQLANASSGATMPAFGIVESASIANNANGSVYISGRLADIDTSTFSAGDVIYVSNVGTSGNTLTNIKPTGTDLIESVGEVLRSHASNGVLEIDLTDVEGLPNVAVHDLSMGGLNITNVVIVTPTIASFLNATHDHEDAAGGGVLVATAALTATGTKDNTTFLRGDDTWAVPPTGGSMALNDLTDVSTVGQATGSILYNTDGTNWAILAVGSNTQVLTLAGGVPTWATAAGDVTGPGTVTDNAIARWSNTDNTLQDSSVLIDDNDNVSGADTIFAGAIEFVNATTNVLDMNDSYIAETTQTLRINGDAAIQIKIRNVEAVTITNIADPILNFHGRQLNNIGYARFQDAANLADETQPYLHWIDSSDEFDLHLPTGNDFRILVAGMPEYMFDGTTFDVLGNMIIGIKNTSFNHTVITPALTVQLDFDDEQIQTLDLTASQDFTTTNLAAAGKAKFKKIILTNITAGVLTYDSASWPAWVFHGNPKPISIGANNTATLELVSTGPTDAEVIAYYAEEA